jgi:hypothetical protein
MKQYFFAKAIFFLAEKNKNNKTAKRGKSNQKYILKKSHL